MQVLSETLKKGDYIIDKGIIYIVKDARISKQGKFVAECDNVNKPGFLVPDKRIGAGVNVEIASFEQLRHEVKKYADKYFPINTENFWDATCATFSKVDRVPETASFISESATSKYFIDSDEVIYRVSDHWGSSIGECNWYLEGHPRKNCFTFKEANGGKMFVGKCSLKDFCQII